MRMTFLVMRIRRWRWSQRQVRACTITKILWNPSILQRQQSSCNINGVRSVLMQVQQRFVSLSTAGLWRIASSMFTTEDSSCRRCRFRFASNGGSFVQRSYGCIFVCVVGTYGEFNTGPRREGGGLSGLRQTDMVCTCNGYRSFPSVFGSNSTTKSPNIYIIFRLID